MRYPFHRHQRPLRPTPYRSHVQNRFNFLSHHQGSLNSISFTKSPRLSASSEPQDTNPAPWKTSALCVSGSVLRTDIYTWKSAVFAAKLPVLFIIVDGAGLKRMLQQYYRNKQSKLFLGPKNAAFYLHNEGIHNSVPSFLPDHSITTQTSISSLTGTGRYSVCPRERKSLYI